ncbi:hypothetical protein LEP1GSC020_4126 [Leptospira interrogans serovar Grippotyphosa str. 2006006986]|uniref:Uncharacterized protein n=1 Tax=Leptospira interrogans serovar Canicola TaxID=211880 RepID=A0AAQ0AX39_LEPIR|nr:hypothetical protein LIMLP_11520 [Leptospira interrogans serovar Manilae]EKO89865.1 hypothetical protein LEP1GSC009_1356 [Leptospira interrogans serovar Grippotyphosa str. Andaman]EKP86449.1 hypothetical protein LEP1GSC020_4126 [Leptospira interrogans serovar Grippotyphosa str. 2006006986]EMJ52199.1 hypothetical protein LEP1GSC111_2828 [Leptospira interrogans str. UT126]EMN50484.1 hypothetical protein LEP1GSC088_2432 [Leptospira interrogans str. L1207]EMO92019.1 hypothetical protein LEP1GSC
MFFDLLKRTDLKIDSQFSFFFAVIENERNYNGDWFLIFMLVAIDFSKITEVVGCRQNYLNNFYIRRVNIH